jgi:hypothetical protein
MIGDFLLGAGCASAAAGSAILRRAWSLPRRSWAWNGTGWGLFALGAVLGWQAAGAWGTAVAALFGMGVALMLLAHAATTAPRTNTGKASNRRVGALPQAGEPWRIGRRIGTFMITIFAAVLVSVGLGLSARGLLAWVGGGEANANVASFFVMPLAWGLIIYALLMEERRARQFRLLAILAVPGVVATVVGLAA